MHIDFLKVMDLVGIAMTVAQKFKRPGAEKEAAVIEAVQELLPASELALGIDFVNDAAMQALLKNYIAARKALANGLANAKDLNVPHPPLVPMPVG